jgi:hypothetical protein
MKPLISIVIPLNELKSFNGGSLNGVKSEINYFIQFLMLYESINQNWKKTSFDYNFYLIHSIPFSDKNQEILDKLDIKQVYTQYKRHKTKIRPICYELEIDCDFRLVLDVDMLALSEPNFDFNKDFQAMYGGNKYNKSQWRKISKYLKCDMPNESVRIFKKGIYNKWTFKEHYLYQIGVTKKKKFPFFNNGAILVKNNFSYDFSCLWDDYRASYTEFVKKEFNINIDLEGQDVVGLAINQLTQNWGVFEPGFNFIIQDKFDEGEKLVRNFKKQVSLLHYIHATKTNKYYPIIKEHYNRVVKKYYNP